MKAIWCVLRANPTQTGLYWVQTVKHRYKAAEELWSSPLGSRQTNTGVTHPLKSSFKPIQYWTQAVPNHHSSSNLIGAYLHFYLLGGSLLQAFRFSAVYLLCKCWSTGISVIFTVLGSKAEECGGACEVFWVGLGSFWVSKPCICALVPKFLVKPNKYSQVLLFWCRNCALQWSCQWM